MKKTAAFVLAILASLAFLVNPGFGALPRYEITDLGTLGGGYGYAGAIDNAAALAGDSCIIDSVNADEIQVPNAFWSASELGWLYTPSFSYTLTGVLTNLGNSHIDGTSPLVTLEVYDGLPVEDANLLRSAQFHPADRSWAGGHFDPLVLTAGEHYFIGFRNVKDLWASHSYDGVPLPIYYGYDNDGTYPFTTSSDVEYAMLKFQGTHIHPLRVPADYPTIQAAIDAAVDGDVVIIAPDTYTGDGNCDIDFLGKAITVRSENGPENCIIDAEGTETEPHRGFYFHSGEDANSIIDGFTVTNGFAPKEYQGQWQPGLEPLQIAFGGAIYCRNSSPTIRNCHLYNNTAELGGAVFCRGANSVISNCTIRENLAYRQGGGFGLQGGTTKLVNCGIIANRATFNGGGISCFGGYPEIMNCTITVNSTDRFRFGGGICIGGPGECVITNSILWGNRAAYLGSEIALFWGYSKPIVSISYSDIRGGLSKIGKGRAGVGVVWGSGNIDAQPCFFDPNNGDYHLLPDSPCIDAGDPNYIAEPNETDLDGKPRIIGGRIDMGAYESPVPAEAKIVPRTINLASKGRWITCYIWLPEDYNVADIDPNSVLIEDEIEPESLKIDEEQQVAVVRFSRSDVQEILNVGDAELTITGRLTDGTVFEGTDIIKVLNKAGKK